MFAVSTPSDGPPWRLILSGIAALIVLMQAVRGWRAGAMRELVGIFALAVAGVGAFFGRGLVAPLLSPLGLPDRQASFVAGAILGFAIYAAILILSAIAFKKTAQQEVALVRVSYGFLGALIGAARGLVIVWLMCVVLRLFGLLAEARVEMAKHPLPARVRDRLAPHAEPAPPGAAVRAVADMKSALDESPVSGLLDRLDPFPSSLHRVLLKTVHVLGDERTARRLTEYPGIDTLLKQPKLAELQRDPEISKAVSDHNYLALVRNEHLQQVITDPELTATLRKFEYEKALDYALGTPDKKRSEPLEP